MIKHGRQSAALVAITLMLFLVGCSTEIRQAEEPSNKETPVTSVAQNNHQTPLPLSTGALIAEHHDETEDLPAIAEENTVFFTLGSSALSYTSRQKLETIAERLMADRSLHVSLVGYANDNGSSSFNLAVSDNRLVTVVAFLRKRGVHAEQMRVQAFGSEKNPSNCGSSKCRQQFRRVDLVILKNK